MLIAFVSFLKQILFSFMKYFKKTTLYFRISNLSDSCRSIANEELDISWAGNGLEYVKALWPFASVSHNSSN